MILNNLDVQVTMDLIYEYIEVLIEKGIIGMRDHLLVKSKVVIKEAGTLTAATYHLWVTVNYTSTQTAVKLTFGTFTDNTVSSQFVL